MKREGVGLIVRAISFQDFKRWEKVACWRVEHERQYLKRVKIEGINFISPIWQHNTSIWGAYRHLLTLFRTVPPRPPTASSSQNWGFATPTQGPKLQLLLSQEWVQLYELQIWPEHSQGQSEQKPIKNFGEKGAWAYSGTAHLFGCPLLSRQEQVGQA